VIFGIARIRAHVNSQNKAQPAANGEPLAKAVTPCWLFTWTPEGRDDKLPSSRHNILKENSYSYDVDDAKKATSCPADIVHFQKSRVSLHHE
jgi:hypothetical protein